MVKYLIAIQPDDYTAPEKPPGSDAASPRWANILKNAGHEVRWVNVRRADILNQLEGCHGFMWRWAHFAGMDRVARRLLPVLENQSQLLTYPDQNTAWHYDDKIAQSYVFKSLSIPTPNTWIWFDHNLALDWASSQKYPLVLKLATGAGSNNVRLVRDFAAARAWIDRLFSFFVDNLDEDQFEPLGLHRRLRRAASVLLKGSRVRFFDTGYDPQAGYIFFQEFLPGNSFDTRVTVVGKRAFAYRRFNRKNDFRASGSGNFDVDPEAIDKRFIRLAYLTAKRLRSKSCAIDGLYKDSDCVVGEVSYTYVSWMVHACPGHWELEGEPESGELHWIAGPMWPEEAQIADFISDLNTKYQPLKGQ
jgi:hypothetical protein